MKKLRGTLRLSALTTALLAMVAGCASSTSSPTALIGSSPPLVSTPPPSTTSQKPVPVESNPPGDISDSTVYIPYRSTSGHFTIKVPEGWARHTSASSVSFAFDVNSVQVSWSAAASAPAPVSAKRSEVPGLQQTQAAFKLQSVKTIALPAGQAILILYQDNSKPNPVTGKQYRDQVTRYELFRNGTEAVITLSAPVGVDTVDPWNLIAQSFGWN